MKDEIKEMLQEIKETVDSYLETYKLKDDMMYDTINYKASQWYALLDYITNLQEKYEEADYDRHKLFEENERLKLAIKNHSIIIPKNKVIDYKSRCEKAIEYLEKYDVFKEFTFPLMKRDEENQVKYQ